LEQANRQAFGHGPVEMELRWLQSASGRKATIFLFAIAHAL
jgi:hypothetical protein